MTNPIDALADCPKNAAARLGVCRAQLYREISEGRLEARKMGRRTLISRAEQARWLSALPKMKGAA